jgi:hypothetical protein
MKIQLTPRDIVGGVVILIIIAALLYLFIPHTKNLRRIDKLEQRIANTDKNIERVRYEDSVSTVYNKKYIHLLDSMTKNNEEINKRLTDQINSLWRTNNELKKNYNDLRTAVSNLPNY